MMKARLRLMLLVAACGVMASCARLTPLDYRAIDEIRPGPGLLSGADGRFVIYRH